MNHLRIKGSKQGVPCGPSLTRGNFEQQGLACPHMRTTHVPFRAPIYINEALLAHRDNRPVKEEQLFKLRCIARNGIIKYKAKALSGRGWPHYYWCFSGGQVPVHKVGGKWVVSSRHVKET